MAVRLASTVDMPRDEWLQIRSRGIGGSEIAAIAGVSPWDTPLSVYLRKIGELPEKDETEAMRWGRILEPVVAEEYKRRHPDRRVERVNAVLQHPEVPYFLANVDRRVFGDERGPGVLEVKTSSAWMAGRWREDCPDWVTCQVQWYLGVLGYSWATVAVLIGGQDYREIDIERDDEIIGYLQEIGHRFWREHVEKRVPPAVEANDNDTVTALYPTDNGQEIDITPLAQSVLQEYDEAKQAESEAKKRREKAEARLKQLIGEHEAAWV